MGKINPFLTSDMIKKDSKLEVFVDVSCDTSNPNNPFPIYNTITNFITPVLTKKFDNDSKEVDIVAIDHLPTLIPRESSINFSNDLLPYLSILKDFDNKSFDYLAKNFDKLKDSLTTKEITWIDAYKLYLKKKSELAELSFIEN